MAKFDNSYHEADIAAVPKGAAEPGSAEELARLRADRDRFVAFAFAASDMLFEVDVTGRIIFATGAIGRLAAARKTGDVVGANFTEVVGPKDQMFLSKAIEHLKTAGRSDPIGLNLLDTNDDLIPTVMSGFRLADANVSYYLSVTFAERLWAQEAARLNRDEDTGLMDEETFAAKGKERMLADKSEEDMALVFLVVDGLKALRNAKDPELVDQFMDELGSILRAASVGGDTAGRLEDDRFGVLMKKPNAEDNRKTGRPTGTEDEESDGAMADLLARLDKLNQDLSNAAGLGEGDLGVKAVEVEIDLDKTGTDKAGKVFVHAVKRFAEEVDLDGYEIDSLSKGVQHYLTDTMDRVARLRAVIDKRNVELAFQVVVDLKTRQSHHFEALTRLEGAISPYELTDFAREIDMVDDYDLAIISEVMSQVRKKAEAGWKPNVAVNVSAMSLQSDLFMQSFNRVMQAYLPYRGQLILEVNDTGRVANKAFEALNDNIQELRDDGHYVILDAVGADPSSLKGIRQLDVDYVKLDPNILSLAPESEMHMDILKKVIKTCLDRRVKIIANGLESDDLARKLLLLGVQYGQGLLIAKPSTGAGGLSYKANSSDRRKGVQVTWG